MVTLLYLSHSVADFVICGCLSGSDDEEIDHEEDKKSSGAVPGGKRKATSARRSSDKVQEEKRMKRLLRNRVSAQQARERKKHYVSNLEVRSKELETQNTRLEQQVRTAHNIQQNGVVRSTKRE